MAVLGSALPPTPLTSKPMTLVDHLEELRGRLFKAVVMVTVAALAGFAVNRQVFAWLMKPVQHVPMVFTNPVEAFKTTLLVSLYTGLAIALPGVLYQLVAFVSPGLKPQEKAWLVPMLVASMALFVLGGWFSYEALLPTGLRFLLGFAPSNVQAMLSLSEYLGFATTLVFAGGALCQLPIVLIALALVGVVRSEQLARGRRVAIVGALALGALLSPSPDIVTQGMMAGLLVSLYEISIWVIRFSGR